MGARVCAACMRPFFHAPTCRYGPGRIDFNKTPSVVETDDPPPGDDEKDGPVWPDDARL